MSKILRKIGKKKRIAGKNNRWKKKQSRLRPSGQGRMSLEILWTKIAISIAWHQKMAKVNF